MQVGDLESDTEDLLVTRDEFAGRLRDSSDRIGKLDSEIVHLKRALIKQNAEMDHLMKQVGEGTVVHKTVVEYVNAPSAPPSLRGRDAAHTAPIPDSLPVDVAVAAIEAKVAHNYDSDALQIKSPPPTPAPLSVAAEKRSKVVFSDAEEEVSATNYPAAAAVPHTPHAPSTLSGSSRAEAILIDPLKSKEDEEEKGREILDDGCLDIIFPFEWNLDLIPDINAHKLDPATGKKIESMSVRVLKDITPDDLIFELRHYVATEVVFASRVHPVLLSVNNFVMRSVAVLGTI